MALIPDWVRLGWCYGPVMVFDVDPASVVPHGHPSLIVREVLERSESSIRCRGRVGRDHPCVLADMVPAVFAIEFAAQTAAVLLGIQRLEDEGRGEPPEKGYLVSLREVRLSREGLPVDRDVTAEVALEGRFGPMALFSARVLLDGEEIASGRFAVSE